MEISGTGVSEDRIATLEKKVREMEALVNGLLDELLDLKAVASKINWQTGEHGGHEQGTVVQGATSPALAGSSASLAVGIPPDGSTVVRPRGARQPEVPAEPAMARIMQSDGTMKMEPRYGRRARSTHQGDTGGTRRAHLPEANRTR